MKSINGQMLKDMFVSAANNLYNHYPEIDALNVFPVPDGDTGMNMNLTLTSGAKEIMNRGDDDVFAIATAFSKGLLMGARGNSGVITSQIFRGFALSLKDKKVIKVMDLADAFISAQNVAYAAVMRPVEGTILTVIRESSDALSEKVKADMSIEKAMDIMVHEARASLKRTPDLLPVLKEVGVVDSGGTGLVTILEGMRSALNGVIIEKTTATSTEEKEIIFGAAANMEGEDEFGYCTEFIMRLGPDATKKPFNEKRFRSVLESRGNSIVLVNDDDIVKVHIHTLTPGVVLNFAQNYGEFVTLKIENMTEQHTKLHNGVEEARAKEEASPLKDFAMVSISVGEGLDELFKEIQVDEIVSGGQTMNPSTEDIVSAIRKCHAKDVFVFPNNGNIIMAAQQASDVLAGEINVHVIPTKTIPQGVSAASTFNPDASAEENESDMKDVIKAIKSGSITYSIKDTTIDGVEVKKNYFMGIFDKKITCCFKDKYETLYALLDSMIDEDTFLTTIYLGEDLKDINIEELASKIQEKYPEVEVDVRYGGQPVYSFLIGVE